MVSTTMRHAATIAMTIAFVAFSTAAASPTQQGAMDISLSHGDARDPVFTAPVEALYGGAAWSTQLQVGTPPVTYGLYIDTGSSDLVVTKTGCSGCSPVGRTYSPWSSSTAHPVGCTGADTSERLVCQACVNATCTDSVGYTTGKIFQNSTFQLFSDIITCGGASSRATLGAIYLMTGRPHLATSIGTTHRRQRPNSLLPLPVPTSSHSTVSSSPGLQDGVIGLAFVDRSVAREHNLVEDLAAAGTIHHAAFSTTLNTTGGLIAFGGLGSFMRTSPITYVPVAKQGFWQISVHSVGLGATPFRVPSTAYALTIIDTGTPTLNLPAPAWQAFQARLNDLCHAGIVLPGVCDLPPSRTIFNHSFCVQLSARELARFPDINYTVAGVNGTTQHLSVPANRYLPANWYSCPQAPAGELPYRGLAVIQEAGWTVLGGPALMHYDVLFDYDASVVGFALSSS